jgi:hypothetical protein
MAIITLVSGLKRLRIVSTGSKGWNEGVEPWVNSVVLAKAMIAWSISFV